MNKQIQKGFTLIELMVVIVIIGILAAIAIPSYLDNANRAKITEGINLMSPIKSGVSESYIGLGKMPSGHGEAGLLPSSGTNLYQTTLVSDIRYTYISDSQGVITIKYTPGEFGTDITAANNELVFEATGSPTGVTWVCKNSDMTGGTTGNLPDKYRPSNCRG